MFSENKAQFLNIYNPSVQKSIMSYTEKMSKIEEMYGVSFYDADPDLLRVMLDDLLVYAAYTNLVVLGYVRDYIDWAIRRGDSRLKTNYAYDYNIEFNYTQVWTNYLINEKDLHETLDTLFREDTDESIDLLYKIYCELLYVGLTCQEILDLRREDVDLQAGEIRVGDRVYSISEVLIRRLRLDWSLSAYTIHTNSKSRPHYDKLRECSGYVIDGFRGTDPRERYTVNVAKSLRLAKNNVGFVRRITMEKIYISGCMDRASQKQDDAETYLIDEYRHMCDINDASAQMVIKDYRNWLKARQ